jgi:hypothetical protein
MANLIEIVFESVPAECIRPLVDKIINGGQILHVSASERPEVSSDKYDGDLLNALDYGRSMTGAVTISVAVAEFHGLSVAYPLIQILMHPEGLDVSISFAEDALSGSSDITPMAQLHSEALTLKRNFNVKNVFCGYEPAMDVETRHFTNDVIGPNR